MKGAWSALLLCCAVAQAAEPSRDDLQRLQGAIERAQSELTAHRAERGTTEQRLKEAEQAIGQLEGQMGEVRGRIETQRTRLGELQRQRQGLQQARQLQEAGIAEQMRLAYQLGQQPNVRLLMRQDEPERISRGMHYLERLNRERLTMLAAYQGTLDELARLEPAIQREASALEDSQRQLQQRSGEMKLKQEERKQALAEIESRIKNKDEELQKLKADREQLEQLLAAIAERQRQAAERAAREAREREEAERRAAAAAAKRAGQGGAVADAEDAKRSKRVASDFSGVAAGKSFAAARGRLPWPVAGSLANFYGDDRAGGALRWQGVTIRAPQGSPVRAVHGGQVVFADWFRGAGQLLVVDHGGGYMTLYAHNQSLAKKVGDSVNPGDVLASVGASGGQAEPGLYFEIRYNGEPQNPQLWCVGRG